MTSLEMGLIGCNGEGKRRKSVRILKVKLDAGREKNTPALGRIVAPLVNGSLSTHIPSFVSGSYTVCNVITASDF